MEGDYHECQSWNNIMGIRITNKGFTLLELMIVMVIVAIGVALAVPAYQDLMQRRETTSKAEQLSAFWPMPRVRL